MSLLAHPAAAQSRPAQPKLILAFGDSLTAGYRLPSTDSFPAQLQARLRAEGRNVTVHNAGVSGDTTTAGRARLTWVLNGLKAKPDLAILALGANDMLRGQPVARAKANLDAMIVEFQRRNIPVLLVGMYAVRNLDQTYVRQFDAMYPELAKARGVALHPFFLDGVALQPRYLLDDFVHPNKQGVAIMVNTILPRVKRELDRAPVARRAG